jgi:hypothetical protein
VDGLGPDDVLAARPRLLRVPEQVLLTAACLLAGLLAGLLMFRRRLTDVGLVLGAALLGQALGTLPTAPNFMDWGAGWAPTLDRYLLPLLPLSLALLVWGARGLRLSLTRVGLPLALAMAVFAVAGVRDHLVFLEGVWSLAGEANRLGVDNTRLDAGAAWDGFYVHVGPPDPDDPPRTRDGPWWTILFAPHTDSSYVVAGALLPGYTVVLERGYWSWLHQRREPLFLLRSPDVAGPP